MAATGALMPTIIVFNFRPAITKALSTASKKIFNISSLALKVNIKSPAGLVQP
jgi:hypothetical protein